MDLTGKPFSDLRSDVLQKMCEAAVKAYSEMPPEQKAAHDYEQRRSFVRGMCPSKRNYEEWCKQVDNLLPPLNG
jgi:hypothetical protein